MLVSLRCSIHLYIMQQSLSHPFFYRSEEQTATPHRDNNCYEETCLTADYQRQSSAESSSSSCSNMVTQLSHETEQHTDTVTSSTYCSDKSRHHFLEQRHTERACIPDSRCQLTGDGQQQKRRPQSLECKRALSSQDDLLEVPETDSNQNHSTVVSPVISIEESQDDENAAIHSMSQISRSPSLTSTCSLSLPPTAAGPGGSRKSLQLFVT